MGRFITTIIIFAIAFIGYDYYKNDGALTTSLLQSVSPEKKEITKNAGLFIEAVFANDYAKAKPYLSLRDMNEEDAQQGFGLLKSIFGLQSGLVKGFTGIDNSYTYSVSSIQIIDNNHARIILKIDSKIADGMDLPATMVKEGGVWKVDYPSFTMGFLFQ